MHRRSSSIPHGGLVSRPSSMQPSVSREQGLRSAGPTSSRCHCKHSFSRGGVVGRDALHLHTYTHTHGRSASISPLCSALCIISIARPSRGRVTGSRHWSARGPPPSRIGTQALASRAGEAGNWFARSISRIGGRGAECGWYVAGHRIRDRGAQSTKAKLLRRLTCAFVPMCE